MNTGINLIYILSALLFTLGLKMLGSPRTARRGNLISSVGMLIAVVATLFHQEVLDLRWIGVGILTGSVIGVLAARLIAMTAMPEMVALLNGFGGIASLLVGWEEYHSHVATEVASQVAFPIFTAATVFLTVLIGGVTFTGSLIAWAKLREIKIGNLKVGMPLLFGGQQIVNSVLLAGALVGGTVYSIEPAANYPLFLGIIGVTLILGVLIVIPIGGADMPVVISLLNSYSGLAACAAGFVISNNILIVAGALVGASGIILTNIMCKAMNRSLTNVLFSGFGSVTQTRKAAETGEARPISPQDTYYLLEAATSVVMVPGYGLAVAQAQHALRELGELLEENGAEVRYAIHPVAGRMPGHMNVLLAEADVPYDQLVEIDAVNPIMETVDVCLVVGANDVVNPAAREDESSPIYGMPIIRADQARTVIVSKRSMATGFAGIQNPLFFKENTRMLFGDAKASLMALVGEFKS
ncbi:MAG: NAD(P)(+) transhydrogenase (Re/Si-specific) subunit beta [Acidobacteriota bacterium]